MLIAVYGTLRRNGGANVMLHLLLAKYIGSGKVYGYKMFACRIPFAVKSDNPDDAIVVEVYDVPDDKVPLLDYYEAGYKRVKANVVLDNGDELEAWMYEWTDVDAVKECELIACGDWVKHITGECRCKKG